MGRQAKIAKLRRTLNTIRTYTPEQARDPKVLAQAKTAGTTVKDLVKDLGRDGDRDRGRVLDRSGVKVEGDQLIVNKRADEADAEADEQAASARRALKLAEAVAALNRKTAGGDVAVATADAPAP